MNVFLSTTPDCIVHAFEVLFSLRLNCPGEIRAYIIVDCADAQAYNDFFAVYRMPGVHVSVYDSARLDAMLSRKYDLTHTKMAFGRLMLFDILPAGADRVLYLDIDAFPIRDGIYDFYSQDVGGAYAAACRDISVEHFGKDELQLCGVRRYFNSGVVLFNIEKVREDRVDRKLVSMLSSPPWDDDAPHLHDQTLLNMAFRENIVFSDPKYNVQSILFGYPQYDEYAREWGYSGQVQLIENCVVSHMQGAKAWEERWGTWQARQLPMKQWQHAHYTSLRNIISFKYRGLYSYFQKKG